MTRAQRQREVERALREHGWSGPWIDELALEAGCTARTIRTDREDVVEYLRDEEFGSRETRRARFLLELRADMAAARESGEWPTVFRGRAIESKILGLDIPPPEAPGSDDLPEEGDPLDRHLAEIRQLRKDAQSRGSMVAAARLLDQEGQVLAAIRERDLAEAERRRRAASDDDVVAQFAASLEGMPDALIERLAAVLASRRG